MRDTVIIVCTLADTVVGCAVQTTLDAGATLSSVDLNVMTRRWTRRWT